MVGPGPMLVLLWFTFHPGSDAFDAADALGLSDSEAVRLTNELLAEGHLAFAE